MDVATADSALARALALPSSDARESDRVELRWLDGLAGVLHGDAVRVQRVRRELASDTIAVARNATRSLAGLWLARTDADAGGDTLKAVSDDAMRVGGSLISVETIDRLVVARALRRRGTPADVERYLMWPDVASPNVTTLMAKIALGPLLSYERGVAFAESGDRRAAAYRLQRFVQAYDQPSAAHRAIVDDARKRLAALRTTDAPKVTAVTPK